MNRRALSYYAVAVVMAVLWLFLMLACAVVMLVICMSHVAHFFFFINVSFLFRPMCFML